MNSFGAIRPSCSSSPIRAFPNYRAFADLAAHHSNVYLDTTMVGASYMEQISPIPSHYPEILVGLSHKVVLGTDFPSIPYPYSHQLQVLNSWGLGDRWLADVLWHTPKGLLRTSSAFSGSTGDGFTDLTD